MLRIYNTLSNQKEEFQPLEEGKVKMYVCGPTVYDNGHLGHGRSSVAFDVIRRYLIYAGYDVTYASNFTDIDDKMIKRAAEEGITVPELAERIIPEYDKDYGDLGVMKPDHQPLATEFIAEMIEITSRLEKGGYVYVLEDGVYFDVSRFEEYGKLSGQNLEELQSGARVAVNEEKRSPHDFVLWKFKKEGEPFWESPWGDGRPGWHIECSAMTFGLFGEKFDIHGGGLDLTFPHHECEIAQSEGCFGPGTFSKYWLHNGFINVDNEKMSKSLGNFFTLKEIFEKYDPQVVRFMYLQTHYRNPVNFSDVLLDQAKAGLERLHGFVRKLKGVVGVVNDFDGSEDYYEAKGSNASGVSEDSNGSEADKSSKDFDESKVSESFKEIIKQARERFEHDMNNDFDTSGALGAVFELVKEVNREMETGDDLDQTVKEANVLGILRLLEKLDKVLGVIFYKEESLDSEIENLIEERNKARANKDFARSDEIRDELQEMGIVLEDTPDGTIWKRK